MSVCYVSLLYTMSGVLLQRVPGPKHILTGMAIDTSEGMSSTDYACVRVCMCLWTRLFCVCVRVCMLCVCA